MPGKEELKDMVAAITRRRGLPPGNPPASPPASSDNAEHSLDTDDAGE